MYVTKILFENKNLIFILLIFLIPAAYKFLDDKRSIVAFFNMTGNYNLIGFKSKVQRSGITNPDQR